MPYMADGSHLCRDSDLGVDIRRDRKRYLCNVSGSKNSFLTFCAIHDDSQKRAYSHTTFTSFNAESNPLFDASVPSAQTHYEVQLPGSRD
jgi:hypothetical protein